MSEGVIIMKKYEDLKLGTCKWTSRLGVGAVILMLIIYTIVCYMIIDHDDGSISNTNVSAQIADPSVIATGHKEWQKDIPVPSSEYQVNWECGTYYSYITGAGMEAYLQRLFKEGWKCINGETFSTNIREGTSSYQLIKEDTVLQLITFFQEEEMPLSNSILLRVDYGISMEDLNSRVADTSNILTTIQEVVDQKVQEGIIPIARQKIIGLLEIFIPEAYERLALQAFAAVSDSGFTGCFLVRKGVVSYVEGDLVNALILDIDQDGSEELVDLYSTWKDGLFLYSLIAYEYHNPIFFSSRSEIPIQKYSNCFVPEGDYEKLSLIKRNDEIRLLGELLDYGPVIVKDQSLVLEDMEHFPYVEWAISYDQSLLLSMDKELPKDPPDINITVDGIGLDYVVHRTCWEGEKSDFTVAAALEKILAKKSFIPKVYLSSFGTESLKKTIGIDFGNSIPDSIQVSDAILNEDGRPLYGDNSIQNQTVKILDSSRVSLEIKQHFALYLSSSMEDYNRDWRRLFLITCKWGEKECVYAFLINTGKDQQLTELSDLDFLQCEGTYSSLSSTWGLGLSVNTEMLPKRYVIEWQVNGGMIRGWNDSTKKPIGITGQHNGFPATYSWDDNKGAIIWNPISFQDSGEVTVRAFIYEDENKKNPLAFDELVLIRAENIWQEKTEAMNN